MNKGLVLVHSATQHRDAQLDRYVLYIAFRGKHRQIERKRDIKGDRYRVEDTEG